MGGFNIRVHCICLHFCCGVNSFHLCALDIKIMYTTKINRIKFEKKKIIQIQLFFYSRFCLYMNINSMIFVCVCICATCLFSFKFEKKVEKCVYTFHDYACVQRATSLAPHDDDGGVGFCSNTQKKEKTNSYAKLFETNSLYIRNIILC